MRHNSSAQAPLSPSGRAGSPTAFRCLFASALATLLIVAACTGAPAGDDAAGTAGTVSAVPATSPGVSSGLVSPSAAPSDVPTGPVASAASAAPSATSEAALSTAPAPASQTVGAGSDTFSAALQTLAGLPIKGRAPKTGYTRDQFGQAWTDDVDMEGGHNGCDTFVIWIFCVPNG